VVIHLSVLKTKPRDQLEFPLEALPWLVDSIENGFWKKPSEGGLPRDVFHVKAQIGGEELRLGRSNNAGAEDVPGFTLKNLSRKDHICPASKPLSSFNEQEDVIPDFIMKEGGFFNVLKNLSERYQRGETTTKSSRCRKDPAM
jgi:hypothetical protein